MALPATDVFTGTNGTQLTTYSANWTRLRGDFHIQTNALAADDVVTNTECGAFWNADAFNAAQYAQGVVTISGTVSTIGVAVRGSGSVPWNFYGYYGFSTDTYLFKNIGTTWTQLGGNGVAWVTNDTIRLESNGTTITPKVNGSTADIG